MQSYCFFLLFFPPLVCVREQHRRGLVLRDETRTDPLTPDQSSPITHVQSVSKPRVLVLQCMAVSCVPICIIASHWKQVTWSCRSWMPGSCEVWRRVQYLLKRPNVFLFFCCSFCASLLDYTYLISLCCEQSWTLICFRVEPWSDCHAFVKFAKHLFTFVYRYAFDGNISDLIVNCVTVMPCEVRMWMLLLLCM